MIIGSHNSWSYLPPKTWWMKPLAFMGKCQSKTIKEQYEKYNVRCFDLRLKLINGKFHIVHNICDYGLLDDILPDLQYLNDKGDVYVRVLHDARTKKSYTTESAILFSLACDGLERRFKNIMFWCGRNLFDWSIDHEFVADPLCVEMYSSVCAPKLIDDWWPWWYAKFNNKKNIQNAPQRCDILLIDFVNIS